MSLSDGGPDRYRDAVRARRAELRAELALDTALRPEIRSALAASRLAAGEATSSALARLTAQAHAYAAHPDRAVRRRLPALLPAALDVLAAGVHDAWVAELDPALRRVGRARGIDLVPALPGPRLPLLDVAGLPVPERPGALAGAVEGLAAWRLALLPLAASPLLGLADAPVLAPLAGAAGAAVLVLAAGAGRAARERAALTRWADAVLAAARDALRADLDRTLLELESVMGDALVQAAARRRTHVEAELGALAPAGAVPGA